MTGKTPAVIANPQRDQSRPAPQEGASRAKVARLLHPCFVVLVHQYAGDEVESRLCSGSDDDLLGRTAHSARHTDIFADRLPEPPMAGEIGIAEIIVGA